MSTERERADVIYRKIRGRVVPIKVGSRKHRRMKDRQRGEKLATAAFTGVGSVAALGASYGFSMKRGMHELMRNKIAETLKENKKPGKKLPRYGKIRGSVENLRKNRLVHTKRSRMAWHGSMWSGKGGAWLAGFSASSLAAAYAPAETFWGKKIQDEGTTIGVASAVDYASHRYNSNAVASIARDQAHRQGLWKATRQTSGKAISVLRKKFKL